MMRSKLVTVENQLKGITPNKYFPNIISTRKIDYPG